MSIEAHVFTPEVQSLAISEIASDMAIVRLFARVLRRFRDWSSFELIESGNLEDGDIVCGWFTSDSSAREIGSAVADRDRLAIEGFLREGSVGACGFFVRDLTGIAAEDRVDLAEVDGDESFAEAMRSARVDYEARSAAGRNDLSILLQFRLTQVIAKQRGGVWTDPVSGDYLVVAKGRWERLPCLVAFDEQNS